MDIVFLRVSKEDEKEQDIEQQLPKIVEKYNLKDYKLYMERGSAWDLKKVHKREKFLEILEVCFDSKNTTIEDIYLGRVKKKKINLYVWDYARIMRNIELNLLFSMLSYWFDVKIYSWKDREIIKSQGKETPTGRMARMMMNTISAFSAEEYSYTISENTKKAYAGNGFSTKGNQWGKGFKATDDNPNSSENGRVSLSEEELIAFHAYIKRNLKTMSRAQVIERVKEKKKIVLIPSYLSRHF